MQRLFIILLAFVIFGYSVYFDIVFASFPSSSNYSIRDYTFGGGGTANSSSTNYKINGTLGQVEQGGLSSTNYQANGGIIYVQQAYVPPAPTFTNPSNWYNKLNLVLNNANNPSDSQFLIAISPDGFVSTTKYVQADNTINTTPVWQTYSAWGGGSGITIIGLTPATTYTVKVAARQGNFTQTGFGPTASVATSNVQFSFSLSVYSVNMGNLNPGSVVSSPSITSTISTNANNGGLVWISDTSSGLYSASTSHTISAITGNLSTATEACGIQGSSVTQTSGGPMEIDSPFNGSSNNVGTLTQIPTAIFDSSGQPVTSGQGTFVMKAKASNTTPSASDYTDILFVIASATF